MRQCDKQMCTTTKSKCSTGH